MPPLNRAICHLSSRGQYGCSGYGGDVFPFSRPPRWHRDAKIMLGVTGCVLYRCGRASSIRRSRTRDLSWPPKVIADASRLVTKLLYTRSSRYRYGAHLKVVRHRRGW